MKYNEELPLVQTDTVPYLNPGTVKSFVIIMILHAWAERLYGSM